MVSASPTVVALDINSAWVVILGVSLMTLLATLALRRAIGRPGGIASGLLLITPLVLPLVAAFAYARGILPEISVLRPAADLLAPTAAPLMLSDGHVLMPFALVGSAGPWLLVFGLSFSSFMMARRSLGAIYMRRLVVRCTPPEPADSWAATLVADLADRTGLRRQPELLMLPAGVPGAFAVGGRSTRILLSRELLVELDAEEVEAILAHEIAHLKARDVQVVFAAGFLRDAVAWNPFAHLAYRKLTADRELEADRRAATITGRPLALASGLLKVCRQVRGRRLRVGALAILSPSGRVSRRVTNLLAMADGTTSMSPVGRLPYLFAAVVVAVAGLSVGSRLATSHPEALAFVWGAPDSSGATVWKPDTRPRVKSGAKGAASSEAGRRRARQQAAYVEPLAAGIAFREKHLAEWMDATRRFYKRAGIPPEVLQWEARAAWQATPLVSGPIGIYRIHEIGPDGRQLAQ